LWLHPLWVIASLPMLDRLSEKRWGMWLVAVLLLLSIVSATYPTWNPWSQNWIGNLMQHLGWPLMWQPGPG
jgi:hypothetical protein